MTACEVLWWKNGTFEGSRIFVGTEQGPSVAPQAEAFFKEKVRELLTGWSPSDKELEGDIENGYFYDSGEDIEVIIQWPTIVQVR